MYQNPTTSFAKKSRQLVVKFSATSAEKAKIQARRILLGIFVYCIPMWISTWPLLQTQNRSSDLFIRVKAFSFELLRRPGLSQLSVSCVDTIPRYGWNSLWLATKRIETVISRNNHTTSSHFRDCSVVDFAFYYFRGLIGRKKLLLLWYMAFGPQWKRR